MGSRYDDEKYDHHSSKNHKSKRDSSSSKGKRKHKREKEKHHKDDRRSEDDESFQSDSSTEFMINLEKERLALKQRKREEKLIAKENETLEEKRERRLKKKEVKALKRKHVGENDDFNLNRSSVSSCVQGGGSYTNESNPFGDHNLSTPFRWNKKLEVEGLSSLNEEQHLQTIRRKQKDQSIQLERVKERRLMREREREESQAQIEAENRAKESDKYHKWEAQEDQFHLRQAKLRSLIRIKDGRAKPIDLLAKYVNVADKNRRTLNRLNGVEKESEQQDDSSNEDEENRLSNEMEDDIVNLHQPYTYLNGLESHDLEDLLEDIKVYNEIEKSGRHSTYWSDIVTIVQHEMSKLVVRSSNTANTQNRGSIHTSVSSEIEMLMANKSTKELTELKSSIELKLARYRCESNVASMKHQSSDSSKVKLDIPYWDNLLKTLRAKLAFCRLDDFHNENLKLRLSLMTLKKNNDTVGMNNDDSMGERVKDNTFESCTELNQQGKNDENSSMGSKIIKDDVEGVDHVNKKSVEVYYSGGYSPTYVSEVNLPPDTLIISLAEDAKRREENCILAKIGKKILNVVSGEERALEMEARKGMTDDEVSFAVESALTQTSYEWSDKYRPRKPRYFNRVHTGFEWNKYNQTHYDIDNPPPKIVQGYKFNIFYPDLIDKSTTPSYTLIECKADLQTSSQSSDDESSPKDGKKRDTPISSEFAILKISAGPPYQDVAFKIVNKEWEYGYRRGFRCQFHNNIFQLWFHFKRLRYRR